MLGHEICEKISCEDEDGELSLDIAGLEIALGHLV